MKRIEEFLQAKNKVEIVFLLRKRDKEKEGNVQLAFKKIDNILENLSQYKVEQMPKLQSRSINFTLAFK